MVRVLDILEDYLRWQRYSYERIDGHVKGNERQAAIDRYSRPDSDRFVFLLCTRAGGGDATPLSKGKLKAACKSVRSKASGAPPLDLATVESMQRKVLECYGVPTDEASGGANTGASVSGDRRR